MKTTHLRLFFKTMNKIKSVHYNTFEEIKIRKENKLRTELQRALDHIGNTSYGVEIDCDAIENIPSSAQTPSAFSVNNVREFVNFFGQNKNVAYLHICEASPKKKQQDQVGRLISYFITDFMRSNAY